MKLKRWSSVEETLSNEHRGGKPRGRASATQFHNSLVRRKLIGRGSTTPRALRLLTYFSKYNPSVSSRGRPASFSVFRSSLPPYARTRVSTCHHRLIICFSWTLKRDFTEKSRIFNNQFYLKDFLQVEFWISDDLAT